MNRAYNYAAGRRLRTPITGRTLWGEDEIETIRNAINANMPVEVIQRLVPSRTPNAVAVKVCRMRKYPDAVEIIAKRKAESKAAGSRVGTARQYAKAREGSEKLLRAILKYYRRRMRGSEEIGMRAGAVHG